MPLLLEWTKPAIADTDEIIDYIFADNPAAAFDFEHLVHESANNLTVLPYHGRLGRVPKTRELIFHPNYAIVYEVGRESVKILRIVHARRKYPNP